MIKNILILLMVFAVTGCARIQPYYFNDDSKIVANDKGKGACSNTAYDCVVMSKGEFRKITGQMPESGKSFVIEYK